MKKGLHPTDYRPVVFQDSSDGTTFLTRSTAAAGETITIDGVEYPLVKVHISSSSHPFFTGQEKLVDIEGRVDKFKARQQAALAAREAKVARSKKSSKNKKDTKTKTTASKAEPEADSNNQ